MFMKTLSPETCKKLKEVLGENAIESYWFWDNEGEYTCTEEEIPSWHTFIPAYTVQDVLSREFLEALGEKLGWKIYQYSHGQTWQVEGRYLLEAYWQSQEKFEEELLKLIEKR